MILEYPVVDSLNRIPGSVYTEMDAIFIRYTTATVINLVAVESWSHISTFRLLAGTGPYCVC